MTVMEKRVDESAVRIACRWMNYQADWFIDNRQILVLVKNMKGNLLRKDLGRSRLRDHHGDTVTRHHSGLGPGRLPVEQNELINMHIFICKKLCFKFKKSIVIDIEHQG